MYCCMSVQGKLSLQGVNMLTINMLTAFFTVPLNVLLLALVFMRNYFQLFLPKFMKGIVYFG